ncbi:nascent polypeptide-associated complex subunit alpha, muscle-specific form [Rhipicephalus sanguineus]|uniref:nascent polypeptide-associated complex subunit alpha, muscle-specific form n=1 Tax=Rhipicephalus sanguineus TaxID=34632 RepID=UPI001895A6BC|nr:nascent polypeptide-associated complex subunit alpha, muscle-specific form [Rhipicephalus sanguineus]
MSSLLHSSLKAFMAELVRAPSPDSACEQDEPWSPLAGGKQGASTEASGDDTQSECSDASNQASTSSASANRSSPTSANDEYAGAEIRASQRRVPPPSRSSAPVSQDSDGDSGIDGSVERFSQRVGSTSSADTEPSSCNDGPVERHELHESPTPSGGNDGGARSSFVAGPPRVHFDEGLAFSEQHMRRSCRQLMAALYASSSTQGAQLDPRSAGRYRSFSLPVRAFEEDESFKRLSVPAARTLPSSFDLDGRSASSGAKLSVAPTHDDVSASAMKWSGSRRSSVPPDSSPALSPTDSKDSRRLDHDVPAPAPSESSTNKHPAYCISATFKCSKGIVPSLKDAAGPVNSQYPARAISSSAQYANETVFVNGNVGQSSHVRQEHHPPGGTSRDSACESPSRDRGMTNNMCSGEARISEPWRTTYNLRTAQPVRTAPREAVVSRVQPTRPVSSHSTSSLSGPKPKTTLPPKALPLSLPGMPPKSSSRGSSGPDTGTMRVLFARPAAVVPEPASHAEQPPTSAARSPSARRSFLSAARPCTPTPPAAHGASRANGVGASLLPGRAKNQSSDDLGREKSPLCGPREAPSCFAAEGASLTTSPKSTSLPTLVHQGVTPNGRGPAKVVKGGVEYAVVTRKPSYHHAVLSPIPRITSSPCVMDDAEPPLPPRKSMHKSDFGLYYGPASSTSSLNGGTATPNGSASHGGSTTRLLHRVQGIGRSARSALLRAFSTERIYRPQKTETAAVARDRRREFLDSNLGVNQAAPLASPSPSPSTSSTTSLVMGLKARMSLRKSKRRARQEATGIQINAESDPLWTGGHPTHVSAQLLQQNLDGTQVVELRRPPGRSFGFFLARGRVQAHHGVFVSRMPDAHTQQVLQGLLDIGDEILEVNGTDVRDADIMTVNSLMTNQSTLLLTVLPYICRKDI